MEQRPLTDPEYEMGISNQMPKGLAIKTALAGHGGSSTRAEIAAGIIACQCMGAVSVGSDSQAFVSRASAIAKMVKNGKEPRRPWSTQKNGDLWQVFHNTLKMKGPTPSRQLK